jgi:biotin carboxyl carrier protein
VVEIGGVEFAANPIAPGLAAVYDELEDRALVSDAGRQVEVRRLRHGRAGGAAAGGGGLTAPITGRLARLAVAAGDRIEKGTVVAVVEAMKMEHVLVAPRGGRVVAVRVAEGAQVAAGEPIAEIAPGDGALGEDGA